MTVTRKFEPPAERSDYPSSCPTCGGTVTERAVTLALPEPGEGTRIVEHVPAGVCEVCGEQFLKAETTNRIDKLLAAPPSGHEEVPVWDFATTA